MRGRDGHGDMKRVTIRVPHRRVDAIDDAVDRGEYPNRSEAIRDVLRDAFDVPDADEREELKYFPGDED